MIPMRPPAKRPMRCSQQQGHHRLRLIHQVSHFRLRAHKKIVVIAGPDAMPLAQQAGNRMTAATEPRES